LEKFLQKDISKYGSDDTQKTGYKLDPEWLKLYLEPSFIADRISRLDETSELTEEQKTAIAQIIQEYDIQQQG
jgi:hypothetical protein